LLENDKETKYRITTYKEGFSLIKAKIGSILFL